MKIISPAEYHAAEAAAMSEASLQAEIYKLCETLRSSMDPTLGYYHTHRSQYSPAGFPDAVIGSTRHGCMIVAELKREAERYQPSDEQVAWLDRFEEGGIPAFLWRPRHWIGHEIQRIVTAMARGEGVITARVESRWIGGA